MAGTIAAGRDKIITAEHEADPEVFAACIVCSPPAPPAPEWTPRWHEVVRSRIMAAYWALRGQEY